MLRWSTPCDEPDLNGVHHCPYMDSSGYVNCERWCHDEPDQDWEPAEYEVFDE